MKIKKITTLIILTLLMGNVIIFMSDKTDSEIDNISTTPRSVKVLPLTIREVVSETIREVTAYNAGDVAQTDSSPCTSANGENICLALERGYNRCAANFVPIGTDLLLEAPKSDWAMECKVTDRMNSRFPNRVDVAMTLDEKQRALNFGKQNLVVKILGAKKIVKK